MKLPWWSPITKGLSYLPFPILYGLANIIAFSLRIFGYRKQVIEQNLLRAFPKMSKNQLHVHTVGFYRNVADIMVESIKSLSISPVALRKRVVMKNTEVLDRLHREKRGVMLVMGHYANFEWVALAMPLLVPHPTFAVYGRIKNPKVNQWVVNLRERFGLTLFQMKDTYDVMLNQTVEAPLYVFMADQAPHKGKIKYRAPFFGIDTPTHLGAENLAKKCNLAVVFIHVDRYKRGHYTITPKLLFEHPQDIEKYKITNAHVEELETQIRKKPSDWLWSHKRWKNK
ncbi:MAG: lysophospholipid acyltransferase family protein [Cryomorphaceae bacterium]|nr:lysophospholipid acyltransferase family protein [Cryomorphaceae bacterium]